MDSRFTLKGSSNPANKNREGPPVRLLLNPQSRAEQTWCLANLPKVNGSPVSPQPPDLTILSDASMQDWGSTSQGRWFSQESIQHINLLELKGAFLAI